LGRGIAHGCQDYSDVRWHEHPKWNDGLTLLTTEKPKSTRKNVNRSKSYKFLFRQLLCLCPGPAYTTNTGGM
jgi:hypothetical protein